MLADKTHDRDPLLFSSGLKLIWRNGEATTGCGDMQHCPAEFCNASARAAATAPEGAAATAPEGAAEAAGGRAEEGGYVPARFQTTVWLYEWPSADEDETADQAWLAGLESAGLLPAADRAEASRRLRAGTDARLVSVVRAYRAGGAAEGGARQVARALKTQT
eukprot:COSAG04_NODE_2354_length_4285_cov_1.560440_5_plen_163_part_00